MKACYCLIFLFAAPLVLAQDALAPVNPSDPGAANTGSACIGQCQQVYADCKSQCKNRSADAHERHFDTPDLPLGECIKDCQADLDICKEDC
jgi:hypothetical protein